ncbi:heparan-alpha-glucosaminide N-acetyltransferase domain-containing protein [uncultured Chitinophaga sp.]|uniref:acyltransferase family protein n=1 Tax=uncultured Chitinophaga sp. TaxID=339340 RepID=UPI0025CFCD36|nr:heparan-alpha-glucosaminide N-acetyltransferase domain-containing protein [uncultured Chitinophaga sp.]
MKPLTPRYLALDVLRGLTIALMIVVNTPGNWNAIYAPFKHSDWHGFTLTDLVFPTFLFVVGNALSFSMGKLSTLSHTDFLKKVLKRTFIIFLIGVLLHAFPFVRYEDGHYVLKDLTATRLWGVLQRIALCYCAAALLIRYTTTKTVIIISIAILFVYWWLLYQFGTDPGPYTLEGNAIGRLDRLYLPVENIYKHYKFPFDPLGLLSTLPAIVNVVAGYFAGVFVQERGNKPGTIIRLIAAGIILVAAGMVWNTGFPINKPLWTSSYVVYTTGFDLLLLGVLIWTIDILQVKKWTYFFEVFGKNPLFIYIIAWVVIVLLHLVRINGPSVGGLIYRHGFTSWLGDKDASLLYSIAYMLLIWLIGYWMDRRKMYVKV